MSIKPLPDEVVNKIKSSAAITSLNGVALGLFQNSLDGGASRINITVDYVRGNCTIEDNGRGIAGHEFGEHGGIGKPHCTSKFPPTGTLHGRNGAFLASLAALSVLCVSSRHHRQVSHNSILLHNSTVLSRHLPAPPEQRLVTFDHGTRVLVRDLFGSMPVRVKHRAATFSDRLNVDKEWTSLVYSIVATILPWSSEVSVMLRDTVGRRELRLRCPSNLDVTTKAARLITQAALASSADVESFVPVSATSGHITIQGCISQLPAATRRSQLISIGIHPLSNVDGSNVLFEEVNKVFRQSNFGSIESEQGSVHGDKFRRAVERWPLFYFNIQLDSVAHADDVLDYHNDDLVAILDLLKGLSYGFLQKHGFRPRRINSRGSGLAATAARDSGRSSRSARYPTPSPSSQTEPSPFDGWHRVKVGHAAKMPTLAAGSKDVRVAGERLVGEGGRLLRKPFEESEHDEACASSSHFEQAGSTPIEAGSETTPDTTAWKDRGETYRTGRVIAKAKPPQPSAWLQEVVRSWDNPVFENVTAQIPRLHSSELPGNDPSRSNYFKDGDCGVMFESASVNLNGRITKSALSDAEVVSQVDKKFILLRLPIDSIGSQRAKTSALVMLDQHAADERCRLEELMANYFITKSDGTIEASKHDFDEPLVFELSDAEGLLLMRYREFFSSWGIVYDVQRCGSGKKVTQSQVKVTALPSSIFERCRGEPRVLIELLRRESWKLAEGGRAIPAPEVRSGPEHGWAANFQGCPRGILELLYSRSCRSAIMFNDELDLAECGELLRRLSRCAFPFQCAHGRPSMAPLVDLGAGTRIGGWQEKVTASSASWKRWAGQSHGK